MSAIPLIISAVSELAGKMISDPDERDKTTIKLAELELKARELDDASASRQAQINLAEAKHSSVFVAGWRPFVGWGCGIGIVVQGLLPLINWAVAIFAPEVEPPPPLDMSELMPLLLALLGVGGMRTYEKKQGIARESIERGGK